MTTLSDDVDDLLRQAMTALDAQVPEGYFDELPARTLARLDDATRLAAVPAEADPTAPPFGGAAADEPPAEAAAPVAPAVAAADELAPRRRTRGRRSLIAILGTGVAAAAAVTLVVSTRAPEYAPQVTMQATSSTAPPAVDEAPAVPPSAGALEPSSAATTASPSHASSGGAASAPSAGTELAPDRTADRAKSAPKGRAPAKPSAEPSSGAPDRGRGDPQSRAEAKPATAPSMTRPEPPADNAVEAMPAPAKGAPASKSKRLEKSPKPAGKKLDDEAQAEGRGRSAPSPDEFRRGMAAVGAAARACFAGTPGTANVKLTVAPSGRVQQATVVGAFAGTPVGACVERAAAAAVFAPWDGEPQRFDYSYVLTE